MNRAELKAMAKAQIKGRIGILFVCYLIIFGIGVVAALVPGVGAIAGVVISPALSVGLCMIYLAITRGEGVDISNLFNGFQCLGKAFWLTILIGIFTFLWSLLFWIPGIIKGLSYSMAFYVLADHPEMTAREALRESKRMMHGHKMDLFILQLSFILWMLLCTVTAGIAGVYVVPYQSCTIANFYQQIKNRPQTTAYGSTPYNTI